MDVSEYKIPQFLDELGSKAPVPGGGGACALTGALGSALASMVGNLTLGKKKYEHVEKDMLLAVNKAQTLMKTLEQLIEKDALAFEPLSRAYGLPKNTEDEKKIRDQIMETALKEAAQVPFEIMQKTAEVVGLHEELAEKGSRIVISDAGVGVLLCKAAIQGAALNVFINTRLMKDREYAEQLNSQTEALLEDVCSRADEVYNKVRNALK